MSGPTARRILRIAGMPCGVCAMANDMALEDRPGVEETHTSLARATTELRCDPSRVGLGGVSAATG